MEMSNELHIPAAVLAGTEPLYPLDRKLRRGGNRVGLETVVKGKVPSPCRDSNPRSFSP
jgi:hypothetical protein